MPGSEGLKLFMVYVGGRAGQSNIELHDVRFVVGQRIEDTYDALRAQWYGEPRSLHVDSYMAVHNIDGYEVTISSTAATQEEHLYFVNLGGYHAEEMAELHEFGLFVASSSGAAKARAKATLLQGSQSLHKDDLHQIDDCLQLDKVGAYFLSLHRGGSPQAQRPDWFGYEVIGR